MVMKVTMAIVASLDGRLTRGVEPNIYNWTSVEDQASFSALIAKHKLIVMGRQTYEAARQRIKLTPDKLRLILTRNPRQYAAKQVAGQLEFTAESPLALIKRLEGAGYRSLLLVGGQINTLFLEAGLVDEIYWTVEPLIFGAGQKLVADQLLDTKLKLVSSKRLNQRGTLLLYYKVI